MERKIKEIKNKIAELKTLRVEAKHLCEEAERADRQYFGYIYGELTFGNIYKLVLKPFRNQKKMALLKKNTDEADAAYNAIVEKIERLEYEIDELLDECL